MVNTTIKLAEIQRIPRKKKDKVISVRITSEDLEFMKRFTICPSEMFQKMLGVLKEQLAPVDEAFQSLEKKDNPTLTIKCDGGKRYGKETK
jgi:hypothetical protein